MQDNDIAPYLTSTVAVMFDLFATLIHSEEVAPQRKRRWFSRYDEEKEESVDPSVVRMWKPREMPLKSLLHMVNHLNIKVDVYTYYDVDYVEHIEHWLARKGAPVQVYSYEGIEALRDDFRFNRDVRQLFTPFEDDAAVLGPRATVVPFDVVWGF